MISHYSTCAVCARRAAGIGVARNMQRPTAETVAWVCDDPRCLETAKMTGQVKQDEFDRIERKAAHEAGDQDLGEYLGGLGKTDLADLSEDERHEAWRVLIAGYRRRLQDGVAAEAPF